MNTETQQRVLHVLHTSETCRRIPNGQDRLAYAQGIVQTAQAIEQRAADAKWRYQVAVITRTAGV